MLMPVFVVNNGLNFYGLVFHFCVCLEIVFLTNRLIIVNGDRCEGTDFVLDRNSPNQIVDAYLFALIDVPRKDVALHGAVTLYAKRVIPQPC